MDGSLYRQVGGFALLAVLADYDLSRAGSATPERQGVFVPAAQPALQHVPGVLWCTGSSHDLSLTKKRPARRRPALKVGRRNKDIDANLPRTCAEFLQGPMLLDGFNVTVQWRPLIVVASYFARHADATPSGHNGFWVCRHRRVHRQMHTGESAGRGP